MEIKCRYCKIKLDDDNWYPSGRKYNNHVCKKCWSIYNKDRYQKNRIRYQEQGKRYYQKVRGGLLARKREGERKLKKELIEKKGGKCELCGYSKYISALDFHHIGGREYRGKNGGFENPKTSNFDIIKVMLVCANCHRWIHFGF